MLRSLRSQLILASVLWTLGLLLLMHMLSLLLLHTVPVMLRFQGTGPILTGLVLAVAGIAMSRRSLQPFRRLRESLTAVRTSDHRRVSGQYPSEVQPLVDNLNALLENREKAVERAITTAGDLAHGLKTPLALLARDADRIRASGNPELAESISQQVERMSRQVNYHLARARAAASGSAGPVRCAVAETAEALVRALSKLYSDRSLDISAKIAPDLHARVQKDDLEEMLGNLLDNACKWGRSKIRIEATRADAALVLTIDDDGPGLAPALRSVVLERGVRLDEAAQGSGLGLAIVRDLAELYRGSISLDASPFGGLRVYLSLPAS
jgi:signal transduction histidine kinase